MEKQSAIDIIMQAVKDQMRIQDIYLEILAPVQEEIGNLWLEGEISVAMEHFATATTEGIMARLRSLAKTPKEERKTILIAGIEGELHQIGSKMIRDFFELEGWKVLYLGCNTPADSILRTIRTKKPDVVALSSTMTFHLKGISKLIDSIHAENKDGTLKIIVGGYPFKIDEDLWKKIGADGYAPDAASAIELANGFFN
jgi:methanogenic corrinoid protein MtbC1